LTPASHRSMGPKPAEQYELPTGSGIAIRRVDAVRPPAFETVTRTGTPHSAAALLTDPIGVTATDAFAVACADTADCEALVDLSTS
ncbi:hypothetical protein ACFCW6_38325, partial [Streptomyces sp. NPDC056333]|uniref:hypothetical protein n=1 Tax=Streptomyces sp. NPDC056333 TaxID=3345786 RepID=UPI0035D9BB97